MSTAIQWTDATWNPTTGCTKVSPGCANCYIERTTPYRTKGIRFIDGHIPVELHANRLMAPLRWRSPKRVFVNSMSDLFHEDVPDQFIVDVFGIMALAHWHTFQVLTKRGDRMRAFLEAGDHGILRQFMLLQQNGGTSTRQVFHALDVKRRDHIEWRWPLPNVWLGVSVENQHFADERIPLLLQTPAAVRFISAEPLLGPVNLTWDSDVGHISYLRRRPQPHIVNWPGLDWVIVGGESGPGARPFDLAWARAIVQQCKAAGVPVFVKQLGAKPEVEAHFPSGFKSALGVHPAQRVADRVKLRDSHGGDPDEWPADLRVREFPEVRA